MQLNFNEAILLAEVMYDTLVRLGIPLRYDNDGTDVAVQPLINIASGVQARLWNASLHVELTASQASLTFRARLVSLRMQLLIGKDTTVFVRRLVAALETLDLISIQAGDDGCRQEWCRSCKSIESLIDTFAAYVADIPSQGTSDAGGYLEWVCRAADVFSRYVRYLLVNREPAMAIAFSKRLKKLLLTNGSEKLAGTANHKILRCAADLLVIISGETVGHSGADTQTMDCSSSGGKDARFRNVESCLNMTAKILHTVRQLKAKAADLETVFPESLRVVTMFLDVVFEILGAGKISTRVSQFSDREISLILETCRHQSWLNSAESELLKQTKRDLDAVNTAKRQADLQQAESNSRMLSLTISYSLLLQQKSIGMFAVYHIYQSHHSYHFMHQGYLAPKVRYSNGTWLIFTNFTIRPYIC